MPRIAPHPAFTIIEAMAAIAIVAIAGSVLLLGTTTSIQNADDAMRRTIAQGMAQQLMDEVVGCRYMELNSIAYEVSLGPNGSEGAAGTRAAFDDIDDFNGYRCQPPTDCYGIALGSDNGQGGTRNANFQCRNPFLLRWRQEVDVYYVQDSDLNTKLPTGQTSDYRVVEVRVVDNDPGRGPMTLARVRRVIPYVSPLSIN